MNLTEAIVFELAPEGVLRAGINFGNPVIAQRDAGGGDPRGVGPSLARELANHLRVPIRYVGFETAGKMADAVRDKAWDVAFLAIDPERATDIAFTDAYVHIEGTYLVRETSPLRAPDDFDRDGVRIAVGLKTAYDLYLTRHLQRAQLVRADSSPAAIERFLADALDAAAGVRQPLVAAASRQPGLRVIDGSFMVIRQAAGVPRARVAAAAYLTAFIEEMKRSGFVARALRESGVNDVGVAPATPLPGTT
jgi:polar amino acid transport system substrate-binding protein